MARLACALLVVLMVGCYKPDLVPVDPSGGTTFCGPESAAVVRVLNKGNADAPASSTTVSFTGSPTPVSQATRVLAAGTFVDLNFSRPAGACVPGAPVCGFDITVDAGNEIDEAGEANNKASGNCVP